jgi:hypothetical protein
MMYSVIAVMIMNMTYAARLTPDAPCSLLLGEAEWKLLYCESKKEPKRPYTMKEAAETSFPKITRDGWDGRNVHPATAIPE